MNLSRTKAFGLTLAAIYTPYLLLFLAEEARQNVGALLKIWIVFPGLALSALIPPSLGISKALRDGMAGPLLFSLLFLALSFFSVWRLSRTLWLPLTGIALASLGLVYVMLLLLRA